MAPEGRRRALHHSDCGVESVWRRRSRAGDRLWHHIGRGLALAAFSWPRLGSDAARPLVVRSDGAGPALADPARDNRGAAPARPTGPSGKRARLTAGPGFTIGQQRWGWQQPLSGSAPNADIVLRANRMSRCPSAKDLFLRFQFREWPLVFQSNAHTGLSSSFINI